MPLLGAEFLKHLESSGLLSDEEVADLRAEPDAAIAEAKALAIRLVQQKKLTPWQARKLLAGRSRGFFIGNYKIIERLGQGGMATVFKAEHTVMQRLVALKVMPLEATSNPKSVNRFQREARVIAQLEHESIVKVYEVGQQGVAHYIVMEFVAGQTLSRLIQSRGRMSAGETAEIGYLTGLGLQHAFERGVIHRDIKPSNIIITPKGKVKILDMGLAMFSGDWANDAAAAKDLTQAGSVLGTVDYVAPEQAKNSHKADTRSDIYSLGCALYECLTGQVPFPTGSMVEKLLAHREDEPAPIRNFAPDTPHAMIVVVQRMMARLPADRFQRPKDLARALAPLRVSLVAPAPAVIASVPATSETKSRPASGAEAVAAVAESIPSPARIEAEGIAEPIPSPAGIDTATSSVSAPAQSTTPALKSLSGEPADAEPYDILQAIATSSAQTQTPTRVSPDRLRRRNPVVVACLWTAAAAALISALVWQWRSSNVGTLVIEIPASERAELELLLDGQPLQLGGKKENRIELKVGAHSLVVKREGYQSEEHSLTIRRGQEVSVRPSGRSSSRRRS